MILQVSYPQGVKSKTAGRHGIYPGRNQLVSVAVCKKGERASGRGGRAGRGGFFGEIGNGKGLT